MTFDEAVKQVNKILHMAKEAGNLDPRLLAMGIEINQRYAEYLDALKDHIKFDEAVTIEMDGRKIKFSDVGHFADWLQENLS